MTTVISAELLAERIKSFCSVADAILLFGSQLCDSETVFWQNKKWIIAKPILALLLEANFPMKIVLGSDGLPIRVSKGDSAGVVCTTISDIF